MTNQQIEYLSQKVAELVIAALEDKQKQWDTDLVQELKTFEAPIYDNAEEKLLTELAEAMTALDYNLKQENYTRCSQLQDEIKDIEKQLKNLK
jgi:Holliday junction resolvasome RuvABC DNA-binding subunit